MPLSSVPPPGVLKPSKTSKRRRRKKKTATAAAAATSSHGSVPDAEEEEKGGGEEEEADKGEDEDQKTLNWLIDAFSTASLHQISSAYRQAKEDPYKAAEILGAFSGDLRTSGSMPGFGRKKGAGRRKQKRVVASTGLVSDVIGKDPARSVYRDGGRRNEEAEEFLFSMVGDSMHLGVVRDVFGHCGYDVEKTLDTLLDISASSYSQLRDSDCVNYAGENQSHLAIPPERFCNDQMDKTDESKYRPFGNTQDYLKSVGNGYRSSATESDGVVQVISTHGTAYFWNYARVLASAKEQAPSFSGDMTSDLPQKVLESLFMVPDMSSHEPSCMNWKKIVKKVENFGQGLEFCSVGTPEPLQKAVHGKADGYEVFRSVARHHWDTMKSYYQKAAMAYSEGERAHAAYLSERGKFFSNLAREAEEKASREIFESRNKGILNAVTIDLHGQHVKQAVGLLKLHLLLFTYIPSIQFLKVITGCGTHGAGKGKLKHSVIGLVQKEGIEWAEENPGTLVIRLDGLKKCSFIDSESDSE